MRSLQSLLPQLFSAIILLVFSSISFAENPKDIVEEILSNPEYQQQLPDWDGNIEIPTEELLEKLEDLPKPEAELPNLEKEGNALLSFLKGCVDESPSEEELELPPVSGEPRTPSKAKKPQETSFMQGCSPSSGTPNLSEGEGNGNGTPVEVVPNGSKTEPKPEDPASENRKLPGLDISSFLKFIGISILLLILAVLLFRFLRDNSEPQSINSEPIVERKEEPIQTKNEPDKHFLSAEEMAKQGRYSEAIHLLLLRAITLLKNHVPQSDFLTAREINRKAPINRKAKHSFSKLLSTSELAHFGGRTLGQEEYQTCAKHYQIFTQNLSPQKS